MAAILGIDAAWTDAKPSGVALVRQTDHGQWESVAVEATYKEFLELAECHRDSDPKSAVPVSRLLESAMILAEEEITLVAIDIPLSKGRILGRRVSDNKISTLFGCVGCGTHSPSRERPGRISAEIRDGFQRHGYKLATSMREVTGRTLIETFPHPALLSLMKVGYRVQYKAGKSTKYWPNETRDERLAKAFQSLVKIQTQLSTIISNIDLAFSQPPVSLSALKSIEDKIDALVCAWVGIKLLEGRAMAIGDEESAIWIPDDVAITARPKDWSGLLASDISASPEFMEGVEDLPAQERAIFAAPERPRHLRSARAHKDMQAK